MKVVVDYDLCEANAICMRIAPDIFKVDDKDALHILQQHLPETARAKVAEAVRRCPRQALSIVED
ncbi:MAG: ferredoxin [Deltaproteobacteria bacterium]|nr:ferredoxin [Deltaproteobacteria bacterium]